MATDVVGLDDIAATNQCDDLRGSVRCVWRRPGHGRCRRRPRRNHARRRLENPRHGDAIYHPIGDADKGISKRRSFAVDSARTPRVRSEAVALAVVAGSAIRPANISANTSANAMALFKKAVYR